MSSYALNLQLTAPTDSHCELSPEGHPNPRLEGQMNPPGSNPLKVHIQHDGVNLYLNRTAIILNSQAAVTALGNDLVAGGRVGTLNLPCINPNDYQSISNKYNTAGSNNPFLIFFLSYNHTPDYFPNHHLNLDLGAIQQLKDLNGNGFGLTAAGTLFVQTFMLPMPSDGQNFKHKTTIVLSEPDDGNAGGV